MPSLRRLRLLVSGTIVVLGSLPWCGSVARAEGPKQGNLASKHVSKRDEKLAKKSVGKKRKRGAAPRMDPDHHHPSLSLLKTPISCPEDMVAVAGRVCVDRYESSLVEVASHELLSPYYPPSMKLAAWSLGKWTEERDGEEEGSLARTMPLPPLPEFEKAAFSMKAMSWPSSTPSGYVSGEMAKTACESAGKRLCSEGEWVTACRGEKQTQFPYGDHYVQDACNVFREEHPAHVLHGEFSYGLSDPRLNEIAVDGQPLLRDTGLTPKCVSKWGDDAIFDMVGNLDEWIDDAEGTFVGGFYARATRSGCDARVRNHGISYFDYSTGVRCCRDPDPPATSDATQLASKLSSVPRHDPGGPPVDVASADRHARIVMIVRLLSGLLKGGVLGGLIVLGLAQGLHLTGMAPWLSFVAASLAGILAGLFTGKAIWQKDAKIEAGLKAFVGALLGAVAMWAIQKWVPVPQQAIALLKPALEPGQVSVLTLPMVTTLLGLIFELDNTPAPEGAASSSSPKARLASPKARVASLDEDALDDVEPAASRRAKR